MTLPRIRSLKRVGAVLGSTAFAALVVAPIVQGPGAAQSAASPGQGAAAAGAPAPQGGGRRQPAPLNFENHEGWTQIFDGQSMKNWDCDPEFWSVVDGALMAKSTREKPAGTIYCPWTGGEPADFELKLEVKLTGNTNSGIQYRSQRTAGRGGGQAAAPGATGGAAPGGAVAPPAGRLPQGHPLPRIRCRARRLNMPGQAARAVGVDALAARPVSARSWSAGSCGGQPAAVAAARQPAQRRRLSTRPAQQRLVPGSVVRERREWPRRRQSRHHHLQRPGRAAHAGRTAADDRLRR